MKKQNLLPLLAVLALLLSLLPAGVWAADQPIAKTDDSGFKYETVDNTITITGYKVSADTSVREITIPDTIDGLPVTAIGKEAFRGNESLTSITIPNSVTSIGEYAFWWCKGLTSITLPQNVTSIGERAFGGSGLTSITIPQGVTLIENGVFNGCRYLTNVSIPENVTSIGEEAFMDCTALTQIHIPAKCTSIGRFAFVRAGLQSIEIPDGVTIIRDSTVNQCTNLTEITIPASVTEIEYYAFSLCDNLQTVNYGGTKTAWEKVKIGWSNGSLSGKTIKCSDGDTTWTAGTAKKHEGLNYWVYGSEFTVAYNDNLATDIVIPEELDGIPVTMIQRSALYTEGNKSVLRSIVIPDSVTFIDRTAFSNCINLVEVILPKNIKTIERGTFQYCSSLNSVTVPGSVTEIGTGAFLSCTSLTSIYIPKSVTLIKYQAFFHDDSLKDVYYEGNASDWANITIEQYNDKLTAATIHYNATAPSSPGGTGGSGGGSGSSTPSEPGGTEIPADVEVSGPKQETVEGTTVTVAEVKPEGVLDALEKANAADKPAVVLVDAGKPSVEGVKLSGEVFKQANVYNTGRDTEIKIAVKLEHGTVTLDKAAIADISGSGDGNVVVSVTKTTEDAVPDKKKPDSTGTVKAVYNVSITVNGEKVKWSNTNKNRITLTVPKPDGLTGNLSRIKVYLDNVYARNASITENNDGLIDIAVPHLTIVSLVEETTTGGSSGGGGGSSKPSIKPGEGTAAPNAPAAAPSGVAGFNDVAVSAWYADAVKYVVDKGLFGGVGSGNFAPDANMTRAMMWTVLARYMGVDTSTGSNWYEAARAWAIAQGISDGTMADGNVTREQFVTMLWRLSGEPAVETSASFNDGGQISGYAKTAVDWAVAQGIVNGYNDGSFKPQGSATRAEVAKMLTVFCTNAEGQGAAD